MKNSIIYIIGAGRSGTTLLDIILGNNLDVLSLGEINRFFKRNGIPPKREKNSETYIFWDKIKQKFESDFEDVNYDKLKQLTFKNEYHTYIWKSILNKNDKEYFRLIQKFYASIFEYSSDYIIVDSSKYPTRALNLSKMIGKKKNIKFIYLKKDPVKVVKSFQKKGLEQPTKSYFASNIYYLGVNMLCILVSFILKRRGFKVSKLKYEDLLNSSENSLVKVSKEFDLDFSRCTQKIIQKKPLNTGYLFDGNRIRLKETILLQHDIEKERKSMKYYFTRTLNYLIYN